MAQSQSSSTFDVQRLLTTGQLPALPQSAIRILEVSKNPEAGPSQYSTPIEADPGLTSQVLRFVNSSYFGFSREISNVKTALTLVGVRTIKNFALWSAVFSLMPNPRCGPFDLRALWQDSLRRALFARNLAQRLGMKEADEPFAAALLQDMAVPLLAKEFPTDYVDMLVERRGGHRLSELELERFGQTHAQIAGEVARHWNLPEELVGPIESHSQIEQLVGENSRSVSKVSVALSSLLPAAVDGAWPEYFDFERHYQSLGFASEEELIDELAQVDADFLEFGPILQVSAPTKSLIQLRQELLAAAPVA